MAEALATCAAHLCTPAGHQEAYDRQKALTEQLICAHHSSAKALRLLEYGCGWHGVQRVIFENIKDTRDRLALFDPFADIDPPRLNNVSIVQRQEIFGDERAPFDIVALSYVLCCVTPEEGMRILWSLRLLQPQAQLLIVDYTLRNRSQAEVLTLLTSREEMKWRERMGEEDFASTRRRFTCDTLTQFVHTSGHDIEHLHPLDRFGIRAAVVTKPDPLHQ